MSDTPRVNDWANHDTVSIGTSDGGEYVSFVFYRPTTQRDVDSWHKSIERFPERSGYRQPELGRLRKVRINMDLVDVGDLKAAMAKFIES